MLKVKTKTSPTKQFSYATGLTSWNSRLPIAFLLRKIAISSFLNSYNYRFKKPRLNDLIINLSKLQKCAKVRTIF